MICATIDQFGYIKEVEPMANGICPNYVLISVNEFAGAYSQITSQEILTDFSWGFGVVLTFWSFGYVIGVAKKVISKL